MGNQWGPALEELLEAIDQEHYDSHDYKRRIGRIREYYWDAMAMLEHSNSVGYSDGT